MEWCDGPSEEVCGQPRRPESHEETTATATLVQIETDQVKPTESQKPLLMVKIQHPLSKLFSFLTIPKGCVKTSPPQLPWLGVHPSNGGGNAPQGR
jgi:hypothetical protein